MRKFGILIEVALAIVVISSQAETLAKPAVSKAITIEAPVYNGPPIVKAVMQITMSLDSTAQNFVGLSVTATQGWFNFPVAVTYNSIDTPRPGGGQTISQVTLPVTAGNTYVVTAIIIYKDAKGITRKVSTKIDLAP